VYWVVEGWGKPNRPRVWGFGIKHPDTRTDLLETGVDLFSVKFQYPAVRKNLTVKIRG